MCRVPCATSLMPCAACSALHCMCSMLHHVLPHVPCTLCCMSCATYHVPCATYSTMCCIPHATNHMPCAACHALCCMPCAVPCAVLHVLHGPCATCSLPCAMYHMPYVTCCMIHRMCSMLHYVPPHVPCALCCVSCCVAYATCHVPHCAMCSAPSGVPRLLHQKPGAFTVCHSPPGTCCVHRATCRVPFTLCHALRVAVPVAADAPGQVASSGVRCDPRPPQQLKLGPGAVATQEPHEWHRARPGPGMLLSPEVPACPHPGSHSPIHQHSHADPPCRPLALRHRAPCPHLPVHPCIYRS